MITRRLPIPVRPSGSRQPSRDRRAPVAASWSTARTPRALAPIAPQTTSAEGYAFLTELVRRLVRAGCRVMETPIVFRDRRFGESKMSARIVVESMLLVTRWGVRDLVARRNPTRR